VVKINYITYSAIFKHTKDKLSSRFEVDFYIKYFSYYHIFNQSYISFKLSDIASAKHYQETKMYISVCFLLLTFAEDKCKMEITL
jgi:hypothetical protein